LPARGLRSTIHLAPSSIGIETVFQARGELPESFLRGTWVPENLIHRRQLRILYRATGQVSSYAKAKA
jgi:hypothetical protein